MKRFRFRFEAVERVRHAKEQESLRVLAEAQKNLRNEKNKKQQLHQTLDETLN
ncbi:MAG: hypothetical protein HY843_04440, partial [Bdellovibrio sp.]|nr:hypothetical protein [Bdellovibrio sp.]